MKLKDWREVITTDFPKAGLITDRTIGMVKSESHRFRGGMRISTSRIWTDKEYEDYRSKVLKTPLP